jgi:hypothetical protein
MSEKIRTPTVPILITLISINAWFGFQTYQLFVEQRNLAAMETGQETTVVTAKKLRVQLDGLASGTSRLAQQGNANAQQIVTELAKHGITINSNEPK